MTGPTGNALRTGVLRALANRLAWNGLGPFFGLLLAANVCLAGVLSPADLKKVEDLRPMFAGLMGDLVQTSRRPDISGVDADCIKSTIQDLVEISQELSSYEYLITIEKDLTDLARTVRCGTSSSSRSTSRPTFSPANEKNWQRPPTGASDRLWAQPRYNRPFRWWIPPPGYLAPFARGSECRSQTSRRPPGRFVTQITRPVVHIGCIWPWSETMRCPRTC